MNYNEMAEIIIGLKNADMELRDRLILSTQLGEGYNVDMANLHDKHAETLNEIIDKIGYPTLEKVGKAASEAASLIIQHSIGRPDFMEKCAELLENEVNAHQADPSNLAYLTDRIAVFRNRPQLYGTQFDWDENGELNPNGFDDIMKVNERRISIGLNTLQEQIIIMRTHVKNENQSSPTDFEERKKEMTTWKRSVGWIK
jgi:hypothetical protein